jgi:hypothetical protein
MHHPIVRERLVLSKKQRDIRKIQIASNWVLKVNPVSKCQQNPRFQNTTSLSKNPIKTANP